MSNRIHIIPTRFTDLDDGAVTLGIRVYDDEVMTYDNTLQVLPDNALDLLRVVVEQCDGGTIGELLDYCRQNKTGLVVSGSWYEHEQIAAILAGETDDEDDITEAPEKTT